MSYCLWNLINTKNINTIVTLHSPYWLNEQGDLKMYHQTIYNFYPLHISCFLIFQTNRHILHDRNFTSKSSSWEILRNNAQKKYQHQKKDRPIKHHMYSKIIIKCKYQMAHKPSKQKPSCTKKMFQQRHNTSILQNHIHNTTKTVVWTWQQN